VTPDLTCLGKGLGGGLPISACIGKAELMSAWRREEEVVHTATFAGAPLACATAIATLDILHRDKLIERARHLGADFGSRLQEVVAAFAPSASVRGQGLMWGVEFGRAGAAVRLMGALLEAGYIVSTGGGSRDVLVLTPPLVVGENQLEAFVAELPLALQACGP
ncbi:MAG: aminotransferase class III-fold pyridoxal phosphate-dependent enzyme, partial [Myxococcales bacterium]|nr:aminotransferase class III-fold pyridoxal phosphate-dependent enzyme [Myxococcales bacterium]